MRLLSTVLLPAFLVMASSLQPSQSRSLVGGYIRAASPPDTDVISSDDAQTAVTGHNHAGRPHDTPAVISDDDAPAAVVDANEERMGDRKGLLFGVKNMFKSKNRGQATDDAASSIESFNEQQFARTSNAEEETHQQDWDESLNNQHATDHWVNHHVPQGHPLSPQSEAQASYYTPHYEQTHYNGAPVYSEYAENSVPSIGTSYAAENFARRQINSAERMAQSAAKEEELINEITYATASDDALKKFFKRDRGFDKLTSDALTYGNQGLQVRPLVDLLVEVYYGSPRWNDLLKYAKKHKGKWLKDSLEQKANTS